MTFRIDGSTVVSETTPIEYRIYPAFQKVLETLPRRESVPPALVMIGVLTEKLVPEQGPVDEHIQKIVDNMEEIPSVDVPANTVQGVAWLLASVGDSLSPERKRIIGKLVSETRLNKPGNSVGNRARAVEASHSSPGYLYNNLFECEYCDSSYHVESDLISHMATCEKRPKATLYECEYCGNKYISEDKLAVHTAECTLNLQGSPNVPRPPIRYDCCYCGETFDYRHELLRHEHSCASSQEPASDQIVERSVTGTVSTFKPTKGYGFIDMSDRSEDIFFHVSDYYGRKIEEGVLVQFDISQNDEGSKAVNVSDSASSETEGWDPKFAGERPRWGTDT